MRINQIEEENAKKNREKGIKKYKKNNKQYAA